MDEVELVGGSETFQTLLERLPRVAQAQRTTLLAGPTGVGKDVLARALHRLSPRGSEPFVAVNCGALPEGLVEAEFFGHQRGAFTGALAAREGFVRTAGRGTLFLDEVDALGLSVQAKLLRFLESGEYRPVGSDDVQRSEAWVLVATNKDLRSVVRAGGFRADLLYRFEVMRLDVPPLAARGDDVVLLARHFLRHMPPPRRTLSDRAVHALRRHDWPGNVRELKHRVEAAAILAHDEEIGPEDLGLLSSAGSDVVADGPWLGQLRGAIQGLTRTALDGDAPAAGGLERALWDLVAEQGMNLNEALETCERILIRSALDAEGQNRTRAAARLGLHVRTIFKKLAV